MQKSIHNVGHILRAQRQKKKFSLEDVHKFVKIHPRFLSALEDGDYSVFSNKIHATGFLKNYAEFLELDVEKMLALWRREYEASFEKKITLSPKKFSSIEPSRILITPGLVLVTFVSILIILFFGYLFFQYKSYSGAPKLDIYSPQNNIVVHSDVLDVTGKTDRDSVLLINNQRVLIDTDGSFATSIKLKEGINTLNFVSVNKLGKETDEILTIIYRDLIEENVLESSESTPSFDIVSP